MTTRWRARLFSVTARLTLWYLAIFGSMIIAISLFLFARFAADEHDALDGELRDYAEFLLSQSPGRALPASALLDELHDVADRANIGFRGMHVMLATRDSILYDATQDSSIDRLVDRMETERLVGRSGQFHTVRVAESSFRTYELDLTRGAGEEIGMVVIAPMAQLDARLARFRTLMLVLMSMTVTTASLGGMAIARRALAPVDRIRSAAVNISRGHLSERVPVGEARDELTALARTFNEMITQIERSFESQRRFIADLSHDLRTPLMVIRTELERQLRRDDIDPRMHEALENALVSEERLTHMVSDLLLLARADAGQLALALDDVQLDEILIDCVASLNVLAEERGVVLRLDLEAPITARCDARHLQRALTNVVTNAIAFSRPGDIVSAGLVRLDDAPAFVVSDTGEGIASGELEQVFDRFYRSDRARHSAGSGLGLAIARTIVEAHGGDIEIESQLGAGTTIRLILPQASASNGVRLPTARWNRPTNAGSRR